VESKESQRNEVFQSEYAKKVVPELEKCSASWAKRFQNEQAAFELEMRQITKEGRKVEEEMRRTTETRFKSAFSPMIKKLELKTKKNQAQAISMKQALKQTEKGLREAEKELALMNRKRAETAGCPKYNYSELAEPRKKLQQGWKKLQALGLHEQAAKHRLAFAIRLENCIPYSAPVLAAYEDKLSELLDAIPILSALQDCERLRESSRLCKSMLQDTDPMGGTSTPDQVEKLALLAEREARASDVATIRAAKLIEMWEAKHEKQFSF